MNNDTLHRTLRNTAIVLTIAWVAWAFWGGFLREVGPGDLAFKSGENYFQDRDYAKALEAYRQAYSENPQNLHALRGQARSLMQLSRFDEALAIFNDVIELEPDFAPQYANRGILHDRLGHYELAIADYEQALRLNEELSEGPNWLTRLLRNQPKAPPTIADRARYLREELDKPAAERLLKLPDVDEKQRPYQM